MRPTQRRLLALALAGGLVACRRAPVQEQAARHLVLVTIDTLRADRLGCYGKRDVATPHLDRIAARGRARSRGRGPRPADAPVPRLALHRPLRRARHPRQRLPLAAAAGADPGEVLKGAGFQTAGFVSSIVLSAQSGLDRGLRHVRRPLRGRQPTTRASSTRSRSGATSPRSPRPSRGWRRARGRRRLPLAPPLRSPRPLRAARALRLALRRAPLRRRGGVDRRAGRPPRRRPGPARACGTTRFSS